MSTQPLTPKDDARLQTPGVPPSPCPDRKPFVPPQLTDIGELNLVTAGSISKGMWEGN